MRIISHHLKVGEIMIFRPKDTFDGDAIIFDAFHDIEVEGAALSATIAKNASTEFLKGMHNALSVILKDRGVIK